MNPQYIEAADEWIGNEIRHLTELLRTERRMRGGMAFKCRGTQHAAISSIGYAKAVATVTTISASSTMPPWIAR